MNDPICVYPFNITDTQIISEHVYADEMRESLGERGVEMVGDWRGADVVHCFETNLYTGDALRAFRYLELFRIIYSDTPLVVSTDDFYFSMRPELTAYPRLYPINHRTQRWLLNAADGVIAISKSVHERIAPDVSTPIHVVHHGVDERYYTDVGDEEEIILHVSFASRRKNPDAVVRFARLTDRRMIVAGGGWEDVFNDPPDNVEVLGYVPETDLVSLYSRATVFYFPTLHEGFGLPVLEAMAASNAVIASDVFSIPEVVGDAGILCDPDDVTAHLAHAERLFEHDAERRALAQAAHERARAFTWERSARKTEAVYRQVISDSEAEGEVSKSEEGPSLP